MLKKINIYQLTLSFLVFSALTACQMVKPNTLGISNAQWQTYSEPEKKKIIDGYHQAQKVKKNKKSNHCASDKSVLQVSIEGGKVIMPPYTQSKSYQPVNFSIKSGDCNMKVNIQQVGNPKQKVPLEVCYRNSILYLDPSSYDPELALGSLQFAYLPLWKRGFVYPDVNSKGLVKFQHANISIKTLATDDTPKPND